MDETEKRYLHLLTRMGYPVCVLDGTFFVKLFFFYSFDKDVICFIAFDTWQYTSQIRGNPINIQ